MEAMEAILTRRSTREYTPEPVPEEALQQLLRAAMHAPSAGKIRPWHFVVIRSRALLSEIARVHPYAQMMRTAPLAIMVCGDSSLDRYKGYWVQDCSAATQNILLAAQALGLGTAWVGLHPMEDRAEAMRKLVGLPESIIPLCLVAVGHPQESGPREDLFDPTRIHQERW